MVAYMPSYHHHQLNLELLESRDLPSPIGLSPDEARHRYGLNDLLGDGTGQAVAIVVAWDHPTVIADLHAFDQEFHLADPPLSVLSPFGVPHRGAFNVVDVSWDLETALDVQWVHAAAPGASILLVQAVSSNADQLLAAVDYARKQPGVSVVSMSWGGGAPTDDGIFLTPLGHEPIEFVAAYRDNGFGQWPALSPNVDGVNWSPDFLAVHVNGVWEAAKGTSAGTVLEVGRIAEVDSHRALEGLPPLGIAHPVVPFVHQLYRTLLHRDPTPLEAAPWRSVPPESATVLFLSSPERLAVEVQDAYRRVLGREADPEGLANWVVNGLSHGLSLQTLDRSLAASPEAQGRAATVDTVFIAGLYTSLLSREGDSVEIAGWADAGLSWEQLEAAFCTSEEFRGG